MAGYIPHNIWNGIVAIASIIKKGKKMKKCPRCHKETLEDEQALNSLSRRGDVYICNPCGEEEAFIDLGEMSPTDIEIRFVAQLDLP